MKLSGLGRAFLIDYEKKAPKAYKDSAGKWTIGIGHLITDAELESGLIDIAGVKKEWRTAVLTDELMDALFEQDIRPREEAMQKLLKREPPQFQYDAMFCLFYNIGEGNFTTSTVRRLFNAGATHDTGDAFLKWNKVRNKKTGKLEFSKGLDNRRRQERAMFLEGNYDSKH